MESEMIQFLDLTGIPEAQCEQIHSHLTHESSEEVLSLPSECQNFIPNDTSGLELPQPQELPNCVPQQEQLFEDFGFTLHDECPEGNEMKPPEKPSMETPIAAIVTLHQPLQEMVTTMEPMYPMGQMPLYTNSPAHEYNPQLIPTMTPGMATAPYYMAPNASPATLPPTGIYAPQHPHIYVENCHVNLGNHAHPVYQGSHPAYSPCMGPIYPYVMNEQMAMQMRPPDKNEFDPQKRHEPMRGGYRGRARGRGRRKMRDEHERSSSVDHPFANPHDVKGMHPVNPYAANFVPLSYYHYGIPSSPQNIPYGHPNPYMQNMHSMPNHINPPNNPYNMNQYEEVPQRCYVTYPSSPKQSPRPISQSAGSIPSQVVYSTSSVPTIPEKKTEEGIKHHEELPKQLPLDASQEKETISQIAEVVPLEPNVSAADPVMVNVEDPLPMKHIETVKSDIKPKPSKNGKKKSKSNMPVEGQVNGEEEKVPLTNGHLTPPEDLAWGKKKVWSELFKASEDACEKKVAYIVPFNADEGVTPASVATPLVVETDNMEVNQEKMEIGLLLKKYKQSGSTNHLLQPRGLINKNYWCYVNAPLQALLACPSLNDLMQELHKATDSSATPFIGSIASFFSEFSSMPACLKSRKSSSKTQVDVTAETAFEPSCVYKMLLNNSEKFIEGHQQDAEEMLSYVLNGLHDEMVDCLRAVGNLVEPETSDVATDINNHEVNEEEWQVQGPKKKSCVTRTAHFHSTAISEIFWGQLRSVVQHAGTTTANLQPFNTLPLDIQSPKVDTLKDALLKLVAKDDITGFTCPKTKEQVVASNQVMLESLPKVLILQLKRFIYEDGGLQKVTKRLTFPIDLEITRDLISVNSRSKYQVSQRKYKLFAVVNHEGKEATKGHYVADVFHNGYNCWMRFDDSNVAVITEAAVLKHDPPKVPYLLFYKRVDMLSPTRKVKT